MPLWLRLHPKPTQVGLPPSAAAHTDAFEMEDRLLPIHILYRAGIIRHTPRRAGRFVLNPSGGAATNIKI